MGGPLQFYGRIAAAPINSMGSPTILWAAAPINSREAPYGFYGSGPYQF